MLRLIAALLVVMGVTIGASAASAMQNSFGLFIEDSTEYDAVITVFNLSPVDIESLTFFSTEGALESFDIIASASLSVTDSFFSPTAINFDFSGFDPFEGFRFGVNVSGQTSASIFASFADDTIFGQPIADIGDPFIGVVEATPIPAPAALWLLGAGLGLIALRRRA